MLAPGWHEGLQQAAMKKVFLRGLVVLLLAGGWALVAHFGATSEKLSDAALAANLLPLLLLLAFVLRTQGAVRLLPGAGALAVLLWWLWPLLRTHLAVLYYLQHVGIMLTLGVFFGRTLLAGAEPLVTRLARMGNRHGISDRKQRYTRQVTLAWTLFFGLNALLSTVLFAFAPRVLWSAYANLLTAPLVGLMFVAEYLCRRRLLPAAERPGFIDTIRAWQRARSEDKI